MVNNHQVLAMTDEPFRYLLALQPPEGLKVRQTIFKSMFVFRSAEYGIDPSDSQTLLDVLLHERFLTIEKDHPQFVYNTDEETARLHMLAAIQVAKKSDLVVDADGHLDPIHKNFTPDMDLHVHHKNVVAGLRNRKAPTT